MEAMKVVHTETAKHLKDKEVEAEQLTHQLEDSLKLRESITMEKEQEQKQNKVKLEELSSTVGSLESEVKQKDMAIDNLTSMTKVKDTQLDELKVEKEKLEKINRDVNSEKISVTKRME